MGCDIHLYIETKSSKGEWYNPHPRYPDVDNPKRLTEIQEIDVARDYELFSALADVRNDNDIPKSEHAVYGLPFDATRDTIYEFHNWDCDAHSPHHIQLNHVNDYANTHMHSTHPPTKEAAQSMKRLYNQITRILLENRNENYDTPNADKTRLIY